MRNFLRIVFAGLAFLLTQAAAAAATLVVGTGTGSNIFPFGDVFLSNPTRYQQVYASSNFSGPLSISSVGFRRASGNGAAGGTFTLSVSTTTAAVDALSTNFDTNVGADNITVFSGTLAPNISGDSLLFNFSSPFSYDPNAGNLLLDFHVSGVSPGFSSFASNNGDANGLFSRMHDYGGGFAGYGLQTAFNGPLLGPNTPGSVPEPAQWALMIGGFGLVGGALRRRAARVVFA